MFVNQKVEFLLFLPDPDPGSGPPWSRMKVFFKLKSKIKSTIYLDSHMGAAQPIDKPIGRRI
jgi:hypothetical protein